MMDQSLRICPLHVRTIWKFYHLERSDLQFLHIFSVLPTKIEENELKFCSKIVDLLILPLQHAGESEPI